MRSGRWRWRFRFWLLRRPQLQVLNSTDGQSLASQDAQLRAAGCSKVYSEEISGARSDRPELAKLLKRLEAGDVADGDAA
jgi:Resolvase, N terminal domain